jgi:hypothetical protein
LLLALFFSSNDCFHVVLVAFMFILSTSTNCNTLTLIKYEDCVVHDQILITYATSKGLDRVYNMVEKETERKYGKDKHRKETW